MGELAKLYFKLDGQVYRVKVFPQTIWIERQPGGDNRPFERSQWPVWNAETNVWGVGEHLSVFRAKRCTPRSILLD